MLSIISRELRMILENIPRRFFLIFCGADVFSVYCSRDSFNAIHPYAFEYVIMKKCLN